MISLLKPKGLQRRVLLVAMALSGGMPVASHLLRREVFDASSYYVYLGGRGPFAVTSAPSREGEPPVLGEARTNFHPGEWLGFTSNLTVEAGVGLIGNRVLVRMSDGLEVSREEVRLPQGTRRQGEKDYAILLPRDLRPGAYELRVRAIFLPAGRPPVVAGTQDFRSYPFEVQTP